MHAFDLQISCGLAGEDQLLTVQEKETCNYEVHIRTPLLCNVPLFGAVQRGKEKVLMCHPLVSEEGYQAYLKKRGIIIIPVVAVVCYVVRMLFAMSYVCCSLCRMYVIRYVVRKLFAMSYVCYSLCRTYVVRYVVCMLFAMSYVCCSLCRTYVIRYVIRMLFAMSYVCCSYKISIFISVEDISSFGSKSQVEALTSKEQSNSQDGGKKAAMFSLPDSSSFDGAIREVVQLYYRDQNPRQGQEVEKTQLLEKLLRKVQPELSAEQMRVRMKALKEKFKDFDLSDLRALVGPDIEGQGLGNEGSEGQESALRKGQEPVLREGHEPTLREGQEPILRESHEPTLREGHEPIPRESHEPVLREGQEPVLREGQEPELDQESALDGQVQSQKVIAEENLNKEEQQLLNQLDLDDESLADLENEITAELKERLSELGFPAQGMPIYVLNAITV